MKFIKRLMKSDKFTMEEKLDIGIQFLKEVRRITKNPETNTQFEDHKELDGCFVWSGSKKGVGYWLDIHDKLESKTL